LTEKEQVYVIPCSGIGKALGTVGRKAAYRVVEELRPQYTRTTCLALLTSGDEETLIEVRKHPCISIDGCPAKCAQKNIEASRGRLISSVTVTDVLSRHRDLKPEGIITLNPKGCELANFLAKEVVETVDKIVEGEN
jgi:uncharacterized metal-binding protein